MTEWKISKREDADMKILCNKIEKEVSKIEMFAIKT